MEKFDIHNYEKKFERSIKAIEGSSLSNRNKKLLLEFKDDCLLDGITKARLQRVLYILKQMAELLDKDFDKGDVADIKQLLAKIQSLNYSHWTIHTYKAILKRFYKWINNGEYPDQVKWIKNNINKKDIKLPGEGDLLNEEEILKLINIANHPRDKALVSVLYESGCRIGEILTMRIKDLNLDNQGAKISVNGKTGMRKIRIVFSVPSIVTWLNNHPTKEKMDPLWTIVYGKHHNKPITYSAARNVLIKLMKKARINKKCNPHLFRHSRATYMANHLTEFQMNQYFGWIQGSSMPSTYVHLSGKEIDNAVLKINGFKVSEERKDSLLKPKICLCGNINSCSSENCNHCGRSLIKEEINKDAVMQFILQDKEIVNMINKKIQEIS